MNRDSDSKKAFIRGNSNDKNDIYLDRKRVIGNNYINLIFFDNSYVSFNVEILKSYVSFFYILVFPYSENFYFLKLKPNPKSKYNITEKVYKMLFKEIIISHDCLDVMLKKIIIILNLYISYILQVKSHKSLEVENAQNVIVNKRSMKAGYAGIENELFYRPKTSMLFGDAKKALTELVSEIKAL